MKYKTKTVYVEAVQWFPGTNIPGVVEYTDQDSRLERIMMDALPYGDDPSNYAWLDDPFNGGMVRSGDWIITKESGAMSVCSPEAFERQYESV